MSYSIADSLYNGRGFPFHPRIQEVCESRSGRPGLPVLMSLVVSVDVKQHWTMLTHWSQFVPNMSTRHQRTWNSTSSSSSFQPLRSHFNPKEVTPCSWPKTIRHFLLFCPTMNQFTQCSPWVFHPWVKSFRPLAQFPEAPMQSPWTDRCEKIKRLFNNMHPWFTLLVYFTTLDFLVSVALTVCYFSFSFLLILH